MIVAKVSWELKRKLSMFGNTAEQLCVNYLAMFMNDEK